MPDYLLSAIPFMLFLPQGYNLDELCSLSFPNWNYLNPFFYKLVILHNAEKNNYYTLIPRYEEIFNIYEPFI